MTKRLKNGERVLIDPSLIGREEEILALATWERMSFPNGSDYRQQTLTGAAGVDTRYNDGWYVTCADGTVVEVGFRRVSVGPGADFGIHYCSRDQAIAALLPGEVI